MPAQESPSGSMACVRRQLRARGLHGIEIGAGHFGGIVAQGMSSTRLEALKDMVAQNPARQFPALRPGDGVSERRRSGRRRCGEFRALLDANPDYSAAYFHGGQTLERLGRLDEARELYERVEVTPQKGDLHTRDEIQAALDLLGLRSVYNSSFGPWRSLASALAWGARGPEFKSRRPDQPFSNLHTTQNSDHGRCARQHYRVADTWLGAGSPIPHVISALCRG